MISEVNKILNIKGQGLYKYLKDNEKNKFRMYNEASCIIQQTLYPLTHQVDNIFNPVNISEMWWLDYFNRCPVSMITDGYINLVDFFYRTPKPALYETTLLINKKFEFVVPKAWEKNVCMYEIEEKVTRSNKEKDELLIFTLISKAIADYEYIDKKYSELITFAKSKNLKVSAVTLCRNNPYTSQYDDYDETSVNTVRMIQEKYGKDIKFEFWEEFLKRNQFNSTIYYSFDQANFNFSHTFIDDHLMSKGATPYENRQIEEKGEIEKDLSLYHKIKINEPNNLSDDFWIEFKEIMKSGKLDAPKVFNTELYGLARDLYFDKYAGVF